MNPKQALADAIKKAGGLRMATLGTTRYLYCGDNAALVEEGLVKKAIRSGETLTRGGLQEYYEWVAHYDTSKTGTDCYAWHPDGNRVRASLIKTVKDTDGTEVKAVIKNAWRNASEVL